MARYTAEETSEFLMNDENFGEMESADSLDDSFSDSVTPYSEVDSDPENDFVGRNVSVTAQQERCRPRTRGLQIRGRVRRRGGSFRGRGVRTCGGHSKRLASEALDDQPLPQAPDDDQPTPQAPDSGNVVVDSDDNWSEEPPTIKNFPFNETPGMKVDVPADADRMFFFNLIFTEEFTENFVKNTNEYADRVISASRPLRRRSSGNNWKNVDVDEMKKLIGIIFSMGIIALPSYKKYWSTDILYKNEHFPSVISRDRFETILRFLNFGEKCHFENDRLRKIRMILDHLNDVMRELVTPEKNLSIDESMMLWCGRLVFRQYIKSKCHKYGIKFYELCTYDGLVLTAEACGGQGFNDENNLGQTAATVLKLMTPYLDKGYHVFTDNYYNSVSLTEYLSRHSTYITGTLRADRKRNPKKVIKEKFQKGDMIWRSKNDITVCKWKDKREVLTISNAHNPEMVKISNRRGKEKMKPNIVRDYNREAIKKLIGKRKKDSTPVSMANLHYPAAIPENQQKKKPTRRCRHCMTNNIRRESRYQCGHCADRPALCVDPCFRLYNQSLKIISDNERSEEENNL